MSEGNFQEIDLIGPGPFLLPVIEGVIGVDLIDGQGPPEIRLLAHGGTELRLPIRGMALADLWNQLGKIIGEADRA
ncbi:MAG: hypothetical protein ACE363_02710 [Alphaproteobacteria bacterium]